MAVYRALQRVVYFPSGKASRTEVAEGGVINLPDSLDHIVGTQINPAHVEAFDLAELVSVAPKRGRRAKSED